MRNKLIASFTPTVITYSNFMLLQRNAVNQRQLRTLKLVVILVIISMTFMMTCVPAPA